MRRFAIVLAAALLIPAAAQAQEIGNPGPDYVTSDNVEYLGSLKFDVGQTTGAKIVGDKLYVTGAKNFSIYDISTPETPQLEGTIHLNVAWENEEVPTNGKILGISSDWFAVGPTCNYIDTNCLQFFDVRDPANIKELDSLPENGDHTSTCLLDCSYFYGSAGSITDARALLDGGEAKDLGSWFTPITAQLRAEGALAANKSISCHHVREIRPGLIMGACNPFVLMSITPEEGGGSITEPKLLAWGDNADKRFVHSVRWPRAGTDKFAFQGGETNFPAPLGEGQCNTTTTAAFDVLDTSKVQSDGKFTPLGPESEYRPKNGIYADGNTPVTVAGCSVHWFEEHPSFHDGGLVALAAYDNGTRFLQVAPDGKVTEQGYFQPIGLETSSPKWVPGTNIVYSIDYMRGIDILRWKGDTYVPNAQGKVVHRRGRVRGTNGVQPVLPALTKRQIALGVKQEKALRAQGWFPGYCQLIANR